MFFRMYDTAENSLERGNKSYETAFSSFTTKSQSSNEMKRTSDDASGKLTLSNDANSFRRYNWTEIERVDITDLQMRLKGLKPFTQYEILLQAFNQHGRGPVAKIEAFTAGDGKNNIVSL